MVSGKPKEVSISTTMVLIIIADISRALTMCQALSPKSHTLTRLILARTLGGWYCYHISLQVTGTLRNLSKVTPQPLFSAPEKKVKIRCKKYTLEDCV